jgi:hypothetical protein
MRIDAREGEPSAGRLERVLGPGFYALYGEDPDRIKVEVVAPAEP